MISLLLGEEQMLKVRDENQISVAAGARGEMKTEARKVDFEKLELTAPLKN